MRVSDPAHGCPFIGKLWNWGESSLCTAAERFGAYRDLGRVGIGRSCLHFWWGLKLMGVQWGGNKLGMTALVIVLIGCHPFKTQ